MLELILNTCNKHNLLLKQVTDCEVELFEIPTILRNMYKFYLIDKNINVVFVGDFKGLRQYCRSISRGSDIKTFNLNGKVLSYDNIIISSRNYDNFG